MEWCFSECETDRFESESDLQYFKSVAVDTVRAVEHSEAVLELYIKIRGKIYAKIKAGVVKLILQACLEISTSQNQQILWAHIHAVIKVDGWKYLNIKIRAIWFATLTSSMEFNETPENLLSIFLRNKILI